MKDLDKRNYSTYSKKYVMKWALRTLQTEKSQRLFIGAKNALSLPELVNEGFYRAVEARVYLGLQAFHLNSETQMIVLGQTLHTK